jgi:hypothetical protein
MGKYSNIHAVFVQFSNPALHRIACDCIDEDEMFLTPEQDDLAPAPLDVTHQSIQWMLIEACVRTTNMTQIPQLVKAMTLSCRDASGNVHLLSTNKDLENCFLRAAAYQVPTAIVIHADCASLCFAPTFNGLNLDLVEPLSSISRTKRRQWLLAKLELQASIMASSSSVSPSPFGHSFGYPPDPNPWLALDLSGPILTTSHDTVDETDSFELLPDNRDVPLVDELPHFTLAPTPPVPTIEHLAESPTPFAATPQPDLLGTPTSLAESVGRPDLLHLSCPPNSVLLCGHGILPLLCPQVPHDSLDDSPVPKPSICLIDDSYSFAASHSLLPQDMPATAPTAIALSLADHHMSRFSLGTAPFNSPTTLVPSTIADPTPRGSSDPIFDTGTRPITLACSLYPASALVHTMAVAAASGCLIVAFPQFQVSLHVLSRDVPSCDLAPDPSSTAIRDPRPSLAILPHDNGMAHLLYCQPTCTVHCKATCTTHHTAITFVPLRPEDHRLVMDSVDDTNYCDLPPDKSAVLPFCHRFMITPTWPALDPTASISFALSAAPPAIISPLRPGPVLVSTMMAVADNLQGLILASSPLPASLHALSKVILSCELELDPSTTAAPFDPGRLIVVFSQFPVSLKVQYRRILSCELEPDPCATALSVDPSHLLATPAPAPSKIIYSSHFPNEYATIDGATTLNTVHESLLSTDFIPTLCLPIHWLIVMSDFLTDALSHDAFIVLKLLWSCDVALVAFSTSFKTLKILLDSGATSDSLPIGYIGSFMTIIQAFVVTAFCAPLHLMWIVVSSHLDRIGSIVASLMCLLTITLTKPLRLLLGVFALPVLPWTCDVSFLRSFFPIQHAGLLALPYCPSYRYSARSVLSVRLSRTGKGVNIPLTRLSVLLFIGLLSSSFHLDPFSSALSVVRTDQGRVLGSHSHHSVTPFSPTD